MSGLINFVIRLLTWWNSQTLGTQIYTWRKGQKVGEDPEGNVFYQTKDGKRRWVVYRGNIEASRVSPQWHGWLHHTFEQPPTEDPLPMNAWEKPHLENKTGMPEAYSPLGSLRGKRKDLTRDYIPWSPE